MQVQEKTQVGAFITFPSMIQNLEAIEEKNDQFNYTKIFFFQNRKNHYKQSHVTNDNLGKNNESHVTEDPSP